jgi:ABC-2 type transport system permease protein
VTNGTLRGLVIIPQDFADRLEEESESPVLVVTDGSETNTANYVRNYASGVVDTWRSVEASSRGESVPKPVELDTRFWCNPELRSRNSLVPGSLAVILAIVGTLLTALVVAREWERGTMEGLLSTPVSPGEFLLSKIVPYLALGFLSMAASVLISVYVFGVPYRSGIFSLTLAGGAFLLSSLGQGLLISTLTKNQFVASQAALVSGFLPAFLLSGFVFEIASMPWLIRQMTRIVPARYLVTNFQTLFLVGDIWPLVLPNVLFLVVIAALFLGVTLAKSPSRYETV